LVWFEFNNVRDGRSENQNLIKKYIKNLQKKLITAENDYKKVALLEEGINFLEGIKNMPDWKKQLSVIDIRQIKSRESIIRSLELRLRNEFVLGFEKEDTNWWKERVDMLNKQIQNTKGQDMVHAAYIRTLNYLGMLAFIYTGKAFREEDKRFARECLWIYELVDPDNPDMFYFWAKYLDYDGNKKKARLYLKNAIDAGYHDMKKARNELSREIWEGI